MPCFSPRGSAASIALLRLSRSAAIEAVLLSLAASALVGAFACPTAYPTEAPAAITMAVPRPRRPRVTHEPLVAITHRLGDLTTDRLGGIDVGPSGENAPSAPLAVV